ncbi:MAG: glycosyltransferase family 2 protein [Coriobacteriia bacterium]
MLGVLVLVALSNSLVMRRFGTAPAASDVPLVSVLVPARDEEPNVERCVLSLLAQDHPRVEVLVIDDESGDGTWAILERLAREDAGPEGTGRLRVVRGTPPPPGWIGKNWACRQLEDHAGGDLLLFTDADTEHDPRTVREAVAELEHARADLVTAIVRHEVETWPERVAVPMMPWANMTFVPLALAYRTTWPAVSTTIGHFMLFRREAYERIGGYASVAGSVIDDVALGRRLRAHGLRWWLLDGTGRIRCRMYRTVPQIVEGFGKNVFALLDCHVALGALAWLALAGLFLAPLLALAAGHAAAALPVALALVLFAIAYARTRVPVGLALLYPLTVVSLLAVGLISMVGTVRGTTTWKGRVVVRQRINWL